MHSAHMTDDISSYEITIVKDFDLKDSLTAITPMAKGIPWCSSWQ